jgi:hypothetical protein
MSGKNKQTKTPPASVGGKKDAGALTSQEQEVRAMLARGSTKPALEQAKKIHKQLGTQTSEALLLDAYVARIRSLLEHGLVVEAKALLELVRERYPSAKDKLADVDVKVAVRQGSWDEVMGALNGPAIPAEKRAEIERLLKCQLTDLSALADCAALAPQHPLRVGAVALRKAFEAVTSGLVSDDALRLPEISHRGPLGPWKTLVRAIAYFYREDDVACERCLQSIDPDSAPARLVPAMQAMLARRPGEHRLSTASASLVDQVGGSVERLQNALGALDAAFAADAQSKIIPEASRAISACRAACPELVERLQQHIAIRAVSSEAPPRRLQAAMGGPAVQNAYFWRLFARLLEGGPDSLALEVCTLWEQFRQHALAEGWFREDGPEAATLYLHMAELLLDIPREELLETRAEFMEGFSGYWHSYEGQPPAIRAVAAKHKTPDFYYLFPEVLFARSCAIDPHRETFERWLEWARQEPDWKAAERVAESWRRALPQDSQPLLYLMESAEQRGALNKAYGFLEQAEKLDALNPAVRRAALRLLVAQVVRQLRQHKPRRAEEKLVELEALPQARETDRPAFLAALRWTGCVIVGETEAASRYFTQVSRLLGGPAAAVLICRSAGHACELEPDEVNCYLPQEVSHDRTDSFAAAVARACALADDMNVAFTIPSDFQRQIFKELSDDHCSLEAPQLRTLAEAALRHGLGELAYAASAAGLAKGGATEARFLLLRARALPSWEFGRRRDCLAVTVELARRQRDMALVDEAVDLQRSHGGLGMGFHDPLDTRDEHAFSRTTEQVNAVLKREKQARTFPVQEREPFYDRFEEEGEEIEEEEEFEEDKPPAFGDLARLLLEVAKARAKRKRARKKYDLPSEQGSLF